MAAFGETEFTTYIGDSTQYHVTRIISDAGGNSYVTGSRQFDGLSEIFIAKLSPSGDMLLFRTLNGRGNDEAKALALDPQGNIYLAGSTTSAYLPVRNPFQAEPGPGFLMKLSPDASEFIYSTYFPEVITALAVDVVGNALRYG